MTSLFRRVSRSAPGFPKGQQRRACWLRHGKRAVSHNLDSDLCEMWRHVAARPSAHCDTGIFFLERCHYTAAVAWLLSSSIPRLPWYDSLLCAQVPSRRRVGGRSRRALRHAHADTKLFLGIALAREGALGGHAARTMTTFVSQRRAFLPLPAPLLRSLSRNSMGLAETRPAADVPTREEPCIQTQRQKPGNTA